MQNTYAFWKSRTFWTIAVTIVIGAVNAAMPFMSESAQAFVQTLLSFLALYFHLDTAKRAGAVN